MVPYYIDGVWFIFITAIMTNIMANRFWKIPSGVDQLLISFIILLPNVTECLNDSICQWNIIPIAEYNKIN